MAHISGNINGFQDSTYPVDGLVPKSETGVINFLQKYPDYNGRDVTIAIFDSGVDPRASGLETLCDGKSVKVIERFDCTGCGDVNVSARASADSNGYLAGLSGHKLKLTPQMISSNTANGEYRIGLKNFYDLVPAKVRDNVTLANKIKVWDGPHKTAIAEAARKIAEFEAQNPETSKLPWDKKLAKDDLDNTLELLNGYEKIFANVKTTYDCIVYSTESGWQTVIDITETGDLENALHIGEYTKTYEIKNIDDYLSVSVNVHDDGNVLEVVGICTSHGTHVASIAGGNASSKDVNGVAPNAKIVSLTIGDGRLGSMETGAGVVRAMIKVMEMCREGRQIDVINMSYGEHAHWSNTGRIGELMSEVVNKYGVVWVASAGNHGPALATVGTPPDISQPSCIGVGAYVSPQMMEAEYMMREKLPANVYTWTSRDPCIDGGQGVTICAPGAAITSVPQYTMTKSAHMNGTSMAAPHVAGAVGLLISGLKQRGISYSPFSIKRAICATATYLSYVDPFAQGSGLLNVEKAFEHLVEHANAPENMIRFAVRCGPNLTKGIHIREGVLQKALEYNVSIEPVFFNEREVAREDKFTFNLRLNLISSQPYVQCGSFLDLSYAARSLLVKVNPSGLPPGVHSAVIRAYDSECVHKGSIFEIPVTIVQPHTINCEETRCFEPATNRADGSVEFQPNTIQRHFILVPRQATWAVLRMRATDQNRENSVGKFFIHTNQLLPKSSCRTMETMKYLSVGSEQDTVWIFNCQGNNIVEVCIAKYWSNYGSTHLKYNVEFHGIQSITPNAYVMHGGNGIHKLELSALVCEELQPIIQLKKAAVVLRPTDSKISPLSARDVIPEGRQIYQQLLTYSLTVPKLQEIAIYAPIFNSMLYEAEFESQLWMVFDVNQMMVSCGDAHSHKFYTKLDKGEFIIRLQIRHEKRELLEKVAETNLVALFKLNVNVGLDIYDHYNQCVIGGRKTSNGVVKDNPTRLLYVGLLTQERIAKANFPANTAWLAGTISFAKDEPTKKVVTQKFVYVMNPPDIGGKKNGNGSAAAAAAGALSLKAKTPSLPTVVASTTTLVSASGDGASTAVVSSCPSSAGDVGSPKKAKSTADEYLEGLRDFQCSMISKCELEKAEKIYSEVVASHPKHLAAHLLLAQNLESKLKTLFPFAFTASLSSEKKKEMEKAKEMEKETEIEKKTVTEKEIQKEEEMEMEKDVGKKTEKESSDSKRVEEEVSLRSTLERIVQLTDIVIKETDKDALLAYYGLKMDARHDAAKIKLNMDKQKTHLIEALIKKGIAMIKLAVIDNQLKDVLIELDNIHTEIMKYVEPSDIKVLVFSLWHAFAHAQYGRMHKCLQRLIDERRSREVLEEYLPVIKALQFSHVEPLLRRSLVTAFPKSYRLF